MMGSGTRVLFTALALLVPVFAVGLGGPTATAAEPDVTIWTRVDLTTADPGDLLAYTIWVHNLGPQNAPSVWVNDTIPTGTAYVDDTAATDIGPPVFLGRSFAGSTVRFEFADFPVDNRSFQMRVRVGLLVSDRQVLQDTTRLWYTNSTGAPQPEAAATAVTTVAIPVFSASKSGVFTGPDTIDYTITISNSGSAAALALWWNDSVPQGVLPVRVRPPLLGAACNPPSGRWLNCTMANVGPGSRTWTLEAQIPAPLPPGSTITNWVFVNYTDSDGTYLREVKGSAPLVVLTANIESFKLADAAFAPPGGTIGYTIFYNNTGQLAARDVWINDTLPTNASLPAVTVVTANPVPAIQTQTTVRWQFANVPAGVHFVSLILQVLPSMGDGAVLVNSVVVNYSDANGGDRPGTVGSATTVISVNVPQITAELVADRATVGPGGSVTLTLYYNNSRAALAAFATVEQFLPAGVAVSSANPLYDASAGSKFTWNLTNVGSGPHRISVTMLVPLSFPTGVALRVTAFVNYTDANGVRVAGSQDSVEVAVLLPDAGVGLVVAIAAAIGIAVIILAALYLYRSGLGDTVIDEVFLLHRDGLLIKHYTRRLKPDVDSDVLSGMLIAVQNFVNESFIGEAGLRKEGELDEMKFGQYRILISRGKYVIIASVVSGMRVEKVPGAILSCIRDLEGALGPVLAAWDGNMDEVAPADRYIQDLLAGKYRARTRFPIRVRRANH